MGSLVARFGIIGAIVVGGFLFRDFLPGAASDLKVGDCFDPPTTIGEEVDEVTHHPCTDPHGAEVVFVGDFSPTEGFPTDDDLQAYYTANCIPAFNAYTGLDFETALEYDMGALTPTEEGWGGGDREITCYLVRADLGQMNASLKAQ